MVSAEQVNSGVSRPQNISLAPTLKVGVLGAGLMGHGIAHVSALAGIDVVMVDVNEEIANSGLNRIRAILDGAQKEVLINKEKN